MIDNQSEILARCGKNQGRHPGLTSTLLISVHSENALAQFALIRRNPLWKGNCNWASTVAGTSSLIPDGRKFSLLMDADESPPRISEPRQPEGGSS